MEITYDDKKFSFQARPEGWSALRIRQIVAWCILGLECLEVSGQEDPGLEAPRLQGVQSARPWHMSVHEPGVRACWPSQPGGMRDRSFYAGGRGKGLQGLSLMHSWESLEAFTLDDRIILVRIWPPCHLHSHDVYYTLWKQPSLSFCTVRCPGRGPTSTPSPSTTRR